MYYNKKENDLNTILLKAKATGRSNITVHYAHRLYIYIYICIEKSNDKFTMYTDCRTKDNKITRNANFNILPYKFRSLCSQIYLTSSI